MVPIVNLEPWAHTGEGASVGAPPPGKTKTFFFVIRGAILLTFSPCGDLFVTFFSLWSFFFQHVGAFLLRFSSYGGFFQHVGAFATFFSMWGALFCPFVVPYFGLPPVTSTVVTGKFCVGVPLNIQSIYLSFFFFLVWKNFIHIKKKLYKKDKAGKQNTTQQQQKKYRYNYVQL